MRRKAIGAALAAMVLSTFAYHGPAGAQSTTGQAAQKREPIYGYSMMSADERNEYREKMRNSKSEQERQALRDEHRKTMETRMQERGIEPGQMRGRGMGPRGPGAGPGQGAGPGPGAGPGAGAGPGPGGGPGPRAGVGPGGPGTGPGMGPGTGPRGPGAGPGTRRGPPDGEPRGPGYGPRGPGGQPQ